jgi:hypothetical protein
MVGVGTLTFIWHGSSMLCCKLEGNVPSSMTTSKFTNHWANTKIEKLCKQQRKASNKAKNDR